MFDELSTPAPPQRLLVLQGSFLFNAFCKLRSGQWTLVHPGAVSDVQSAKEKSSLSPSFCETTRERPKLKTIYLYLSIYLSIYLIYLSIFDLSIYQSIFHLSIYLYGAGGFTYLSIYLSTYLFVCLSIYSAILPSIYLSIYLFIKLCIYLAISPSIYLSIYRRIYLFSYLSVYLPIYLRDVCDVVNAIRPDRHNQHRQRLVQCPLAFRDVCDVDNASRPGQHNRHRQRLVQF